jgi:hypothetical protein
MEPRIPREDSARVLAVAAATWGMVIGGAGLEGAFARFEGSTLAALAVLASLYAAGVYFLDPGLRAYVGSIGAMRARMLAAAFIGALVASLAAGSAPVALFFVPLATLAGVAAAAHGVRRSATSTSSAKSPGASPAAT